MAGDYSWFSYINRAASATITADSEETALPATNVANRSAHLFWRTQAATATLSLDFGSAVTYQAIVLQFASPRDPASVAADEIATTDTITLAGSNVSAGASEQLSETVNSNVIRERGYFAYVASSEITGQYLDITITATSRSALGYFDLGYVHAGPIFQPNSNYNIGATIEFDEESLVNVSPTAGAAYVESRGRLLGFNGLWGLISATERESWHTMQEKTGITAPIAFGTNTTGDLSRKAMIARFNDPMRISIGQNQLATARVSLTENR